MGRRNEPGPGARRSRGAQRVDARVPHPQVAVPRGAEPRNPGASTVVYRHVTGLGRWRRQRSFIVRLMASKRFSFLTHDAFGKLPQNEKVTYVARAAAALDRTLSTEPGPDSELARPAVLPGTLGATLYANAKPTLSEKGWVELVQAIATGDQHALHALYGRAHRLVYSLITRIV